jgi:hypothetical protein
MRGDEECSKTIEWLCRANQNDNYNRQEEPYAALTTDEKYIPQKNAARSHGGRRAGASGMKMTRDLFKGYRLDVEGEFFKG